MNARADMPRVSQQTSRSVSVSRWAQAVVPGARLLRMVVLSPLFQEQFRWDPFFARSERVRACAMKGVPETKRQSGPKDRAAGAPAKCRPGTEDSNPALSSGYPSLRRDCLSNPVPKLVFIVMFTLLEIVSGGLLDAGSRQFPVICGWSPASCHIGMPRHSAQC